MQELEAPGDQETCPICQVMISPPFLVTIPQGSGKRCRVDQKAPRVSYKIHIIRLSNRESLYSELCFSLLQPSEQDPEDPVKAEDLSKEQVSPVSVFALILFLPG